MGNVGVVGCSPLFTRCPAGWLFFDQRLLRSRCADLSTGLYGCKERLEIMTNLWISLWLNSGKNAPGSVITGLWLSGGFSTVAPFWGVCMRGVPGSSKKVLPMLSIPCGSGLCAFWKNFSAHIANSGTRPAITLVLPSFGDLGTGRPRIPSLTPKPQASPRFGSPGTGRPGTPSFIARGDGSPAASGHRPLHRSTPHATAEPPPGSAAGQRRSCVCANSRPCH